MLLSNAVFIRIQHLFEKQKNKTQGTDSMGIALRAVMICPKTSKQEWYQGENYEVLSIKERFSRQKLG